MGPEKNPRFAEVEARSNRLDLYILPCRVISRFHKPPESVVFQSHLHCSQLKQNDVFLIQVMKDPTTKGYPQVMSEFNYSCLSFILLTFILIVFNLGRNEPSLCKNEDRAQKCERFCSGRRLFSFESVGYFVTARRIKRLWSLEKLCIIKLV